MVTAYRIKRDRLQDIPAVTHADGTGRLQTVERESNPLYWKLIRRFGDLTGVPDPAEYFVQRERADREYAARRPSIASCAPVWTCWRSGSYILLKSENLHASENKRAFALA